jgi:tetratricopeptide (TPR) repeat protein
MGDAAKGKTHALIALQAAEGQASLFQVYGHGVIASAEIAMGEYQQAEDSLIQARAAVHSTDDYLHGLLYLSDYFFAFCEYHLAVNKPELVLEFTEGFLNHPHFQKGIAWLPYYWYYRSCALYDLRRYDQAGELLAQAEPPARRLKLRGVLWKIYALQAKLQSQVGNPAGVQEYNRQAREIIDEIVALAGNSGLGEKFLSQPAIQAIYTHTGSVYNG